jgi:hypothetical protein
MYLHVTLFVTNIFPSTVEKIIFILYIFMSCCLNEFGRDLKETLIKYSEVNITCLNNYNTGVCVCLYVCGFVCICERMPYAFIYAHSYRNRHESLNAWLLLIRDMCGSNCVHLACSSAVLLTAGATELTGRCVFCVWKVVCVYQLNNICLNHHCVGRVFSSYFADKSRPDARMSFYYIFKGPFHWNSMSTSRHRLLSLPEMRSTKQRWQSV